MKKLFVFILCFFTVGCSRNNNNLKIETIVDENKQFKVTITYPITGYKAIDKSISSYVNNCYSDFLSKQDKLSLDTFNELNIDYTYYENNDLISITLFKYENKDTLIKTYNYSYKQKKLISIDKIVDKETIYNLANTIIFERFGNVVDLDLIKINLYTDIFSIDNDNIYLYYQPNTLSKIYSDLIIIDIPLEKVNITFNKVINVDKEIAQNDIDLDKVNYIIDTNKKVIALTFDDGPSAYTEEIIEILKNNDAVATFFVLGNKVKAYADVLAKSIEYGNEIGNHTFNHKWLTKLSDDEVKKQIEDTQNIIYETLGYTPTLFRPSYGSINKRIRNDISLNIILWNIDTMDWKYRNEDKIISKATSNVNDGNIILMHETYKQTKNALEDIIKILKEKDFVFVTISELEQIKALRKYNEQQTS